MSFIYRNQLAPSLAQFSAYSTLYKKFDRVWPKTSIDGISVYSPRLYFYTGYFRTDTVFKNFLVAIGINFEEFVSQNVNSEVEAMWFYLRTNYTWDGSIRPVGTLVDQEDFEPTTGAVAPTATEISTNFNNALNQDEILSVTVTYGGDLHRYIEEHALEFEITDLGIVLTEDGLNTEEIRTILHSNPWYYFANARHIAYDSDGYPYEEYNGDIYDTLESAGDYWYNGDMPLTKVSVTTDSTDTRIRELSYGAFALMGDETIFEPLRDFEDNIEIYDETISTVTDIDGDGEIIQYSYTIKYRVIGSTTASSQVVLESKGYYDFLMLENTTDDHIIHANEDTLFKRTLQQDLILPYTNSLFYKGCLRVDAASYMKRKDFVRMLVKSLKTDYSVEEASWWEKAFAFVIIIIAIVLAVVLSAPSAGSSWSLPAVAAGLTAASLTLTVGMFLLSAFGGLSAQKLTKQIGAFAQVVGIAALVTGIAAAYQAAVGRLAAEQLAEQGIQEATAQQIATQAAKNTIFDNVVAALRYTVMDIYTAFADTAALAVGGGSELTNQQVISALGTTIGTARAGFDLYASKELDDMQNEINDAQAELDRLNDENDSARRTADPLYVLVQGIEDVTTYDALTYMELEWKMKFEPGADINEFTSERTIV